MDIYTLAQRIDAGKVDVLENIARFYSKFAAITIEFMETIESFVPIMRMFATL